MFDNAPSHQKRAPDAISARKMVKSKFFYFGNHACVESLTTPQTRSLVGRTTRVVHPCAMASSRRRVSHNHFIFLSITPPCPGGSRAWNKSSGSAVSGRSVAFPVSALVSDAQMDRWIAAATGSCSTNPTSRFRSPNLKSWLSHAGTYATSIQNTIVNSTSSSNTGGQQNFGFVLLVMQGPSLRWRKKSLLALMMSRYSTSDGQFLSLLFSSVMSDTVAYRYANRSARFIHSYGEGLTGAQAAWANRKYHGHRTLPPEMVTQLKQAQFT